MPPEPRQPTNDRRGWRFFPSSMPARERRIYGAVAAVFGLAFLASVWPVYPLFSRIRPLVLGVPFSLAYLVGLLLVCFFSLLALYRWEARHGRLVDDDELEDGRLSARALSGDEDATRARASTGEGDGPANIVRSGSAGRRRGTGNGEEDT